MHSSNSIAQFAGALAKAQVDLVNPAKTLIATLPREAGERGGGQTYRYAPLSAGLDIIRKALGQQEIAVLQTTHVEQEHAAAEGGMLVLTSTLVHASGEWVATTWPVCRLTDVSDPKLLGAALTYARRYSLFALVGITGDDDLDAPDLRGTSTSPTAGEPEGQARRGSGPVLVHRPSSKPHARRDRSLSRVRSGGVDRPLERQAASPAHPSTDIASSPAGTTHNEALLSLSELMRRLGAVSHEEASLCWAMDALRLRGELDEPTRAALDQAFLWQAHSIGADPDMLTPFASAAHPERPKAVTPGEQEYEAEPGPEPLPSSASAPIPSPQGAHDAQAL